ncbi:MAG: glutathione peroxidase, partial [Firmicutes bacterium]|nr:glutathione peroxidase [Bacillota bacterium]
FPLFAKTKVKGPDAHPLFQYLTREAPGIGWKGVKWNFTKFLVDSQGQVLKRFAPSTKPSSIIKEIEPYLPIQA